MTEWEKAQNGYLYDANYDKEIIEARTRCADLCYELITAGHQILKNSRNYWDRSLEEWEQIR